MTDGTVYRIIDAYKEWKSIHVNANLKAQIVTRMIYIKDLEHLLHALVVLRKRQWFIDGVEVKDE